MIQLFIMKTTKLILSAFVATTFLASCGGGSHEPKKAEEAAPEAQAEEASHESHTYTDFQKIREHHFAYFNCNYLDWDMFRGIHYGWK